MLTLVVCIDGHSREDLVRELREALARLEAGEDRGVQSNAVSGHDFAIRPPALLPPGSEAVGNERVGH